MQLERFPNPTLREFVRHWQTQPEIQDPHLERKRERVSERERERERRDMCVCMCVRERERQRDKE